MSKTKRIWANGPTLRTFLQIMAAFAIFSWAAAAPGETVIYNCNFKQGLAREWKMVAGNWALADGCLTQTDASPADPKKAMVIVGTKDDLSSDVIVTAKLRINSWDGGSDSRAGISVCMDPVTGHGYGLVFHRGKLQFMQDSVAWSEGCDFPCQTGKWYWLKLRKTDDQLSGKAWADGDPEPSNWMTSWKDWNDSGSGYPGLDGGAMGGPASLSFAEFRVERITNSSKVEGPAGAELNLNGTWRVLPEELNCIGEVGLAKVRQEAAGWMDAEVPGEIHLDLVKASKMPEPTVGLNMPQCRWPGTNSWWYRTTFDMGPDPKQYERQSLVFDGLDLFAQVFVNGKLAGEAADAFVPAVIEVKRFLKPGRNELVVRLTEGSELAPSGLRNLSHTVTITNDWKGRVWLRKPQFEWGWDWVEGLPNIGIWRGVRLESHNYAVLHDLRLDTVRQGDRVFLELELVLENLNPSRQRASTVDLEIEPPDGGVPITRRYAVDALPGRMPFRDLIEVPDAKLWWPNGMGDQPLYKVVARISGRSGRITYDRREFSIGLRTIDIDRQRLDHGTRFCLRVNGKDVFCRGGNLGPQDPILARVSDAKYQALVSEAKNAHMNMFRLNGVAEFEAPAFYDACDRAGILIWHDFMFACSPYPEENEPFMNSVRKEIEAAILMLRSHPSIALWSGNNECFGSGEVLSQRLIPDLCRQLDPRRPHWPGSPSGGSLAGDSHGWYCEFATPRQIPPEFAVRFVTEYGILGPCHPDSIHQYLGTDSITRGDANWTMHTQGSERSEQWVSKGIRANYADPDQLSAADWVVYGQMWQAIIQGKMMEALRFQKKDPKDDCEGALIWSYTDCVGETGWAILDYYLRRKAAYYSFRRAAAPVKVIVRERAGQFLTRVVNDTLQPVNGTVEAGWWRLDGAAKETESRPVAVEADGMIDVPPGKATAAPHDPHEWVYAATLRDEDGQTVDQSICLLTPYRELKLMPPQIKVTPLRDRWLEVSSRVFVHAAHAEDHGHELISDNWFDLLPGTPIRIRVAEGVDANAIHLEAVMPR